MRAGYHAAVMLSLIGIGVCSSPATGAITIGQGPWIGTDTAGNVYYEEFQDWTWNDCHALDGAGAAVGGRYNFNDGFDDSRDLIAFYSRVEGNNVYFRVDLYDLALGAENGNLDIYVAIDCAWGGQTWMPDWTDVQVTYPWEVCVKLYSTPFYDVVNYNWTSVGGFLGAYYHSQIDTVEFGITKETLLNHGWDGSSVMYFTVMTTKDGSNGGPGEIYGGAGSDATDTFYDDDRGYTDGFINGAIASNATVGRAKYASIAHGNQTINQDDDFRVHVFDPPTTNQTGFIRTLDTHEIFNVPLNIHVSGSFIVGAKWAKAGSGDDSRTDGPAFLQRVADFVDLDQNDHKPGALVGGVFAEHIMPYFEGDVNATSINQFTEIMQTYFALTPNDVKVMHTPERVIRSQPTGLTPLDGLTFQDIENSDYAATYIDEVTHLHWWFYPDDAWSGYNGGFDAPRHHKVHKINNVLCLVINDREDQAKFGPMDGGMHMDTRYTLVDKASQADQAQLTLVFDDWEALAGKSFDPSVGHSVENNNQMQYQQTIRWAANHPWIEGVTLKEIVDRATNPANPKYDPAWIIDHGTQTNLSIQTYEWLKHASENSYHYWYYNEDSGYTGNEQDFYELVPVILGPQGDYHARQATPANDGPPLPSGKRFGDLNTPNTLLHDAWAVIASAPLGMIRKLAEYTYTGLIYETAWHEEDDGSTSSYQGTNFGNPWPHADTTWDGLNTWALKLHNHVRSVGILADAADWADDVKNGVVGPQTVMRHLDLDQDGEEEYVLSNNRVYLCFERYGGRLTHGFAFRHAGNDAIQVMGVPVANPSSPGEEELVGPLSNRCSSFKDMNYLYVDTPCRVDLYPNALRFTTSDGMIAKYITLPAGSGTLQAEYFNNLGATHYVRIGASPNVWDLMLYGRDHLTTASSATQYRVNNSAGGFVRVFFETASYNATPADAGFENRNLALTEQIELSGGSYFTFAVQMNSGMFDADADGDVDLLDLKSFENCLGGPDGTVPGACGGNLPLMDWDQDDDVDLADFARFQESYTGNITP